MTTEERVAALETRVAAIEVAISKDQKLKDFEAGFGSSPAPLEYTGKIKSPLPGEKFLIPDFTALGGRVADRSGMLNGEFVPDNPDIRAIPEWFSNIDGYLAEGLKVGLAVKSPGNHVIVAKYAGKVLDYVIVDAQVVDCSRCGG